jgi:predicted alpha/beta-hydrolase family hydrolase
VPVLLVHGTRDPFGTIEELDAARKLIPGKTALLRVDGAGHDLGFKGKARREELAGEIVKGFQSLVG